ncbi:MAG: tetratricopeptide repeat protein [Thermogemmata sp.]|nr:tetratricopeptide repeat protein [Thermogemmata sp.]
MLITSLWGYAQNPGDGPAEQLLQVARKAYAEGNAAFAADRFREFLQKYGGHKEASAARLGLGLALLDLAEPDYAKAWEALQAAAQDANFAERAQALYYAAVARRGWGHKELLPGLRQPAELGQRQQQAAPHFTEAARLFGQAAEALSRKQPPAPEWAARATCDQAEMELLLGRAQEARKVVEPLLKTAPATAPWRPLALYYHGAACYQLGDLAAAARSLDGLAPFDQPFGLHARYLRGRIHLHDGEQAEAAAAFQAVLQEYERRKAEAAEQLKQPDRWRGQPWEKARLEALVQLPPPDYVAGAAFYAACLHYEAGRFAEALTRLQGFTKEFNHSPLREDALLRIGFCQVQLKQWDEAVRTLQPLTGHPQLGVQAHFWIGKARLGQALAIDPGNVNERNARLQAAVSALREAVQRTNPADAAQRGLRAQMMLELADALLYAQQAREAAGLYDQLVQDKILPPHKLQEALERSATAYHLAGDLAASEARIAAFVQQHPQSPLLPWVLFRSAENAYRRAEQLRQQNHPEAATHWQEAARRYQEVVSKYPEFDQVQRARLGLALCRVALRQYEEAIPVLEAIPAPSRSGELAVVSYLLADCLLRTAPEKADDALADNMLREKLGQAMAQLDAYLAAVPKAEQTADALLKLGICCKRLAAGLPAGNERNELLGKGRGALERLLREFAQAPQAGAAQLERAKVLALQGDKAGAINTLRQFQNDPWQRSPVAPLAYVYLATLLREQNQAAQAADLLRQARDKFEGTLQNDPTRKEWIALLRYHHGIAWEEAGRLAEARTAFEQAVQVAGQTPLGADALSKALACAVQQKRRALDELRNKRVQPNLPPDQANTLDNQIKAVQAELSQLGRELENKAEQLRGALAQHPARARLLYDAAWVRRLTGEDPGPVYARLVAEFASLSLTVEARLEWAELLAEAGKLDEAIRLLRAALEAEPTDRSVPPETIERLRLRLGAVLFDKRDYAAALGQWEAVAANEKSPYRPVALYRAGEALLALGKADEAIKRLAPFRDQPPLHQVAGVSDRAVLRLGHAYSQLKQWEPARQVFDLCLQRYGPNGRWAVDARYGLAWSLQQLNRLDEAVGHYQQVAQQVQDDRAGKARLQIGEIRARQGRWNEALEQFQMVAYAFDLPELKFPALLEQARALTELKKPAEASKVLERVLQEAPKDSPWAAAARERLGKLPKP